MQPAPLHLGSYGGFWISLAAYETLAVGLCTLNQVDP
jgi:succinate-acetate transporter protein